MRRLLLLLPLLYLYTFISPVSAAADPGCSTKYPTCRLYDNDPNFYCTPSSSCSPGSGGSGKFCCSSNATLCPSPKSCTQVPIGSDCTAPPSPYDFCKYPSGGFGNFCCNTSIIPTPTPGQCTSVPGQYCAPSAVDDCTGAGGTVVPGSCPSNWTCCRSSSSPPPPPPPGGPPGGSYTPGGSTDPRAMGFDPLKYPCDETADPEFHPQRPYPASPCDPLIPDSSHISFSCGKSLDAQGTFSFPPNVDVNQLAAFDQNTAIPDTLYRCDPTCQVTLTNPTCEVCAIKRVGFDIALDLRNARVPILGNTQDPLDDATKVNNYLNWYFNGTIQHSEQQDVLTYTPPTSLSGAPLNSPDQLGAEIDEFFAAGAAGYLVWQYGDQPGSGIASGDQYTFYQGSPICQTLLDKANANPGKFVGVNAPSLPQVTARIQPALSYLKNCGVKVVRIWGVPVSGSANVSGLRQVLDAANANGIRVIIVLADYSNSSDPILPGSIRTDPTQWYATGYLSTGYRSYVTNLVSSLGNHPALYAYELANEPHCGGKDACVSPYVSWAGDVSAAIRQINGSVRVGIGQKASENTTRGDSPGIGSPADFTRSNTSSGVTASSGHYYNTAEKTLVMMALAQSANLGKPFYVGEAGFTAGSGGTGTSSQLTGIDRLINYSGPLKKLLPYVIQKNIKDVLNGGPIGNLYHDYFVIDGKRLGNPLLTWSEVFKYVPFSSLEDTTGEFTVGLIPEQQPGNPADLGTDAFGQLYFKNGQVIPDITGKNAIFLTIKPEAGDQTDSRLYFPHVRSLDVLSRILASTFRPSWIFNSKDLNSIVNNLPDDTNPPQYPQYDYLTGRTDTRNTQVIPGSPAPPPLINYGGYDQLCDLSEVRVNPGDSLVGSTVTARLGYTQIFRYTPQATSLSCLADYKECATDAGGNYDASQCCSKRCTIINWDPANFDPNKQYCAASQVTDVNLPTEGRVGVFVKSPLLDQIYDTLVTGSQSILNRFLPKRGQWEDPRPGGRDIPGAADAVYSGTGQSFTAPETGQTYEPPGKDTGVTTGKHTSDAKIYFKHLGSIMDYFLGAGTDNKNLQKLLRPQGFSSGSLTGVTNPASCSLTTSLPPLPPINPACNSNTGAACSKSFTSSYLQQIFESAATAYNVPVSVLVGVFYNEGGLNSTWDNTRTLAASGPNCIDASTCGNTSSTGAKGPWQFLPGTWSQNSTAYLDAVSAAGMTSDGRSPNICNIVDTVFAAAKTIHIGYGGNGPYNYCSWYLPPISNPALISNTRIGASSSCNWPIDRIGTAARQYLGYCEQPTNFNPQYPPRNGICTSTTFPTSSATNCYEKSVINIATCASSIHP